MSSSERRSAFAFTSSRIRRSRSSPRAIKPASWRAIRPAAGESTMPWSPPERRSSPIGRRFSSSGTTPGRRVGLTPRTITPVSAPSVRASWSPSPASASSRLGAVAMTVASRSPSRASSARRAAASRPARSRAARSLVTTAVTAKAARASQSLDELITSVCLGGRKKKLNDSADARLVARPHHRP